MQRQKMSLLLVALALAFSVSWADEVAHVASLQADLDMIVSTGVVYPVDGITSAGQPDEAALKVFAEQGYTTVIDLRTAGEDRGMDEASVVAEIGMRYVQLPIGPDSISFENAKALDKLIADAAGPVLVHCGSGNRVGALLALRKSLAGADDASALEYGKEGGLTSLEAHVTEILGSQ